MKKIYFIGLSLFATLFAGCLTDETETRRTLEAAGFSNISVGEYVPFACSEDDISHTSFTAKNPVGKGVSGVVCCGFLKGCTIRF